MIIGITGRARHGKNTVGDVLVRDFGFKQYGFADALKEMALRLNPWVPYGPYDYIRQSFEHGGHGRARLSF